MMIDQVTKVIKTNQITNNIIYIYILCNIKSLEKLRPILTRQKLVAHYDIYNRHRELLPSSNGSMWILQ